MPDDVGERLLDNAVERELKRRGELTIGAGRSQLDGCPGCPHGVRKLFEVGEPRRGRERGGSGFLVAQQPEHDTQLVLGGPPDHLDRFERGARLLGALRHQAPAHPGLDGDHRERVGDDVVQLAGDAYPLLADLLPGALGLGGSLALGLLGQPGHVTPARRHAISDEPPGRERQEAQDGPGRERGGPFRCPAYRSAAPKIAAAASAARIDSRRGTPAATVYPDTPSTRLTSSDDATRRHLRGARRRWPGREQEAAIGGRTRSPGRTSGWPERAPVRARASAERSPGQSRPRRPAPSGPWRARVAAAR